MIIDRVRAEVIRNSRKEKTIDIKVFSRRSKSEASAPSGASIGKKEEKAFPHKIESIVKLINKTKFFNNLEINKVKDLEKIERNFPINKIGADGLIALEYAILKELARINKKPLFKLLNPKAKNIPLPLGNVVGGGAHFKGKGCDFQEFLLIKPGARFKDAIQLNKTVHAYVKRYFGNKKTDEGAWAPNMSNLEILEILKPIVKKFGLRLGIDIAASQIYKNKKYVYNNFSSGEKKKILTRAEQISFVNWLIKRYNLYYVEDPLEQNDFLGFKEIKNCLVCGDDLTVTHVSELKKAIGKINCVIVKPNQIGSLLKTIEFINLAKKNDITCVISHRSGETMDSTISHLAVAFYIPIIKCGIYGKERESKLKELDRIARFINKRCVVIKA